MAELNYYILNLKNDRCVQLRETRKLRKRGNNIDIFKGIKEDDRILILNRERKSIIAEYEIDQRKLTQGQIYLRMEPIYNAPPTTGVKLDEFFLSILTTFNGYDEWKKQLETQVIKLNKSDFDTISNKLKN